MAKAAKTKKAAADIETVYVPGSKPRNLDQIEAALAGKFVDGFVQTRVDEAVIVQLNPGTQLLMVRWVPGWHDKKLWEHRRKQATWLPVMRLDETEVGSRDVVFGRPWQQQAGITPELMALAEDAFGRADGLGGYLEKAKRSGKTAERVEVEAVVQMHGPRIGILWVRYEGLVAPAGRWQSGAILDVSPPHPDVAIG